MNTTQAKILTVFANELAQDRDIVQAAWNACHKINAEAVAAWGPEWDGKAFDVAAHTIRDSIAEFANA